VREEILRLRIGIEDERREPDTGDERTEHRNQIGDAAAAIADERFVQPRNDGGHHDQRVGQKE
jgi:hypothetical protein